MFTMPPIAPEPYFVRRTTGDTSMNIASCMATRASSGSHLTAVTAPSPPSLLVGITLGMKISRGNQANIQKWAATHSPAVPVYEAAEDESTFAIDSFRVT